VAESAAVLFALYREGREIKGEDIVESLVVRDPLDEDDGDASL
jgi:hypothetical protein